jgi:hypothetical protein
VETVRFDASQGPRIVRPTDGLQVDLGGCGARLMITGEESGGGFSLVEHPIPPRHLAAPVHRHSDKDEYSFVLEGRLGALLGDEIGRHRRGPPGCRQRCRYSEYTQP